jgi:hypothetical protein
MVPGDDRSYETVSGHEAISTLSYIDVCDVASEPSWATHQGPRASRVEAPTSPLRYPILNVL